MTLNAIFSQVEKLTKKSSVDSRVRCLLKDVLDIRNSDWQDRRPKKIEGPLKLQQVAAKAVMETGNWVSPKAQQNDWETVGKERLGKLQALLGGSGKVSPPNTPSPCPSPTAAKQQPVLVPNPKVEKTTKNTGAGAAMLEFLRNRDQPEVKEDAPVQAPTEKKPFDREASRVEISATLAELRVSYDVPEAITRIANIGIPVPDQQFQIDDLLTRLTEEGTEGARKAGFSLMAGLVLEGHWNKESAAKGVRSFVEETCPDLKFDVPALPQILREELHPALAPVVKAGFLEAELQNALMSI